MHSNVLNELVENCNEFRKKISYNQYHLIPNNCVHNPNKLSTENTEKIVSIIFDNERKCIMRFVILAMTLYVLINPMIYIPITLHIHIIQSFMSLMNVLYEDRRAEYMYQDDHDKAQDMVFCKCDVGKTSNFMDNKNDLFVQNWSERICRTCLTMLSKNFIPKRKIGKFFIHNKRPCFVQFLTAKTTWYTTITGSKGQTEVTPLQIYKHPVNITFFRNKTTRKVKKCIFGPKINIIIEPQCCIFKKGTLETPEIEKLERIRGNSMN